VWLSIVRAVAAREAASLRIVVVVAVVAAVAVISGYVVRRRQDAKAEGYLASMRRIVPSKKRTGGRKLGT